MKKGLLLASALLVSGAAVAQTAISEEVNKSLAHWLSVPVIKQDLSKAQMLQAEMAEQGNATVAKAAAKKADQNLQASYKRPAGAFYSNDVIDTKGEYAGTYYAHRLWVKPLQAYTFVNTTTGASDAATYNWAVQLYRSGEQNWYSAKTKDLEGVSYGLEIDSVPMLQAKDGSASSVFFLKNQNYDSKTKEYVAYSHNVMSVPDASLLNQGGFVSMSHDASNPDGDENQQYAFTYYSGAKAYGDNDKGWWFGKNAGNSSGSIKSIDAFCSAFEAPTAPYALKKVAIRYANLAASGKGTIKVNVYKQDSLPTYKADKSAFITPGELIASGEVTVDASTEDAGYLFVPLTEKDGDLTYEVTPTINSAILVEVTGYNSDPNIKDFSMLITSNKQDEGYGELTYLKYVDKDDNVIYRGLCNFFQSGAEMKNGASIGLVIDNPYMVYNFSNETGKYKFPNAGGAHDVQVFSYAPSSDWVVTDQDGNDAPAWLGLTLTDSIGTDNAFSGLSHIKFNAQALPSDVKGRGAVLTFTYPGAELTFEATQGEYTGVNSVATKIEGVQAKVENGDFLVNVTEGYDKVEIYNVAGQLVKAAALTQGTNLVEGKALPKGVYLLKFGNKTVKVAK